MTPGLCHSRQGHLAVLQTSVCAPGACMPAIPVTCYPLPEFILPVEVPGLE